MQVAFHVLFSPTKLYPLPPGCALCDVLSSPYLQLGSDLTSFCLTIQSPLLFNRISSISVILIIPRCIALLIA